MSYIFKGKEIEIQQLDGINHRDAPDYCDAFISLATWVDSGDELTDEEYDELNDSERDIVYSALMNHLY